MIELAFALLALLAIAGSAALLIIPLVRRRPVAPLLWAARNGAVTEEKTSLVEALRQLEFDYQLGSLTAEDYQQLQASLRRRTLAALRAEDQQVRELDEAIEQAIVAERARRQGGTMAPTGPACPQCGNPISGAERFCSSCGSSLEARQSVPESRPITRQPVSPRRTGRRTEALTAQPRALSPWMLAASLGALLLAIGVGWVVFNAPNRMGQAPIATVQAPDFHTLAFSPRREGLVFLGTHNGLLASIDGGRTWGAQPVPGDILAITHHPNRPLEVFATGHEVFAKSDDGGRTWMPHSTNLPGLDIHAFTLSVEPPYPAYAFVVGHGLFTSEETNGNWQRVGEQVPGNVTGIAAASGGHPALYLATLDQGVLASADGRQWRPANGVVNGALPTLRITSLAFDPGSGDSYATSGGNTYHGALYAGTDNGLFKSIDAGTSWTRLNLNADVAALTVHPSNPETLLVVDTRGQVFLSEDRGLTWPGDR